MLMFVLIIINFALILFVIALLMGNDKVREALGITSRKKKNAVSDPLALINEKLEMLGSKVADLARREDNTDQRIDRVLLEFASLTSRIANLETQKKEPGVELKSTVSQARTDNVNELKNVTKYAQQTTGGGFDAETLLDNQTKFTKFILNIKGNMATYEVPVSEECQSKILNGYASISPLVEEVERIQSPTAIVNVELGTLKLEAGRWVVLNKLKIKLV